jgi:hypothetical protein
MRENEAEKCTFFGVESDGGGGNLKNQDRAWERR